jgi:hypothetical protein
MGSAYTDNNKFEKIGTGEQAGTWGTTTNLNFDMIDRAINGVKSIGLTGTASSLTTSDGTLTDGLFKVLQFTGSLSSLHTITISPNDVEKLYFINNNCGASVKFTQGSGGDVTIENASTAIIFCDGAGGSAKVTKIETGSDAFTTDVTIKTDDGALLTLQTGDTTITDGDVLGALQFQAPSEGSGTDGAAVAGAIVAEADAEFTDEIASTDLVFKVGTAVATDNAAVEKMRLTHEGDLELKAADGAILKLQTTSDSVNDGNVLGAVEFNAPLEAGGTDAITTAAAIVAESDSAFDAATNQTDLVFKLGSSEAATEKMRLTHEGDLTVSTSFTIGSASLTEAELEKLDGITNGAVAANKAVVVDGNLDAGTFRNISASGTISAGEVTATSDERLKSDIKTIDNALDKVMNMRGVSFTKQAERGIGVIAQEVEKIIPEVVHDGEYKSVAYGNMVGVLIEAIKEQQKQIDELKKDKYGSSD